MDKKYQIFVSSTYSDLIEERQEVQDTILSMYHFPIGMEMFSAADEDQWEIIKETIDSSDYYILIIGHRYGSIIENEDSSIISYTEKEYRYAKEKGIPILAFIIDKSVRVLPENMESDMDKMAKLEGFIKEVTTGRTVEWWNDKKDLTTKVSIALLKQFNRNKRPGWIRSDSINIAELQNELLELTKKVRILETENNDLKNKVSIKIPNLSVLINDGDIIKLQLFEDSYEHLDADFVPITGNINFKINGITQKDIDVYNNSLPTKEELKKYKEECLKYDRITKHSTDICLTLVNMGNMKANDIHIEMQFPKEIIVLYKDDAESYECPKPPKIASNPLYRKLNILQNLNNNSSSYTLPDFSLPPLIKGFNQNQDHWLNEDNSISVRIDALIHEYNYNIKDEYVIYPTQKGEFEVICNIMCEEYEHIETQIIKVIVE